MPEINYKELKNYLQNIKDKSFAPVYLIHGEEFLCKKVFDDLLNAILPGSTRQLNHEPIDPDDGNIFDGIESLNTFSFLSGPKVVSFTNSKIFYSKKEHGKLIEKAKENYEKKDIKKAVKSFLSVLSLLNLSLEDMNKEGKSANLELDGINLAEDKWIKDIITHCKENNISIPPHQDHAAQLEKAIQKTFPKNNTLIITTDFVDKRRTLFKTIKEAGVIIDCFIPKGDRFADKKEQDSVRKEYMNRILQNSGKQITADAYQEICEITGFDLHIFSSNIEKLINYAGDRTLIGIEDVRSVLQRSKLDPIYELTNAVSGRKADQALFFLDSLVSSSVHLLQILQAVTNQMRKLLVAKGFTESSTGRSWNKGVTYEHFKNAILPLMTEYDKNMSQLMEKWESALHQKETDSKKSEGKNSKSISDLFIAKNPSNPYPLYQTLVKSELFTKDELIDSLKTLNEVDLLLKTSGVNPRQRLEIAIIQICQNN